VTLNDFELAEAIFIIGQNPGTNHPDDDYAAIGKRKVAIVSINPLRDQLIRFSTTRSIWDDRNGTKLSDLFCQCGSGAISRF